MALTIDELQIEIQASSSNAASGIDALEQSLRRLRAAVAPLSKGGVGLTALGNSLKKFSDSVSRLSGLNLASKSINDIAVALQPLEKIQKSGFSSIASGLAKITQLAPQLGRVTNALMAADINGFAAQIQRVADAMRPLAEEAAKVYVGLKWLPSVVNRVVNANSKLQPSLNKTARSFTIFGISIRTAWLRLSAFYIGMRRIARVFANWIDNSNQYVENLNLFTVAMGKYTEEAKAYAEQVQELFGIDASEFMRYQGVFMNMAKGFGIAEDKAAKMSKNLTQLGYDLASLYNVEFNVAMEKLESALSGQPRPMREWGFDLSEATLKAKALAMGIEKNVELMSQAEKAQLRYVQLLETAQKIGATGDFARTLNTTANQLRVLKAQVDLFTRALGNILVPILNKLLPYGIAFLKIMRDIANSIANFFGFELPEIDYSSLEEMGAIVDEDAEAVEELKNALLGIDELNILNDNKMKSVLEDTLDLDLPEYDFLKDISESKIDQIAEKMRKPFEDILILVGSIGAGILAWKISDAFISSIMTLQRFFESATGSTVITALSRIGGQLLIVAGLASQVYGTFKAITEGVDWGNLAFMIGGVVATVGGLALAFGATAAAIGLIVGGVALLITGFIDLNKNGLTLQNTLLLIAGTLSTGLGISLLTHSAIPMLIAGLALVAGGIVDIVNNGVTLENSILVLSGLLVGTVSLAIKAAMSGMVSLGVTIGLVGLAVTALVGSFLYISSVWDQMTGLEKVITIFVGLASAALAAAFAIAVFHASWTQGLAVAGIVGALAAIAAAFIAVKNNVSKVSGISPGQLNTNNMVPYGAAGGGYAPQGATYGNVAVAQGYQEYAQQSAMDSKEIIRLLSEIANKDPNLYVDGEKMTQKLYPYIEQRGAQRGTMLVR